MGRTKERRKFIHEPSTHETFYCLGEMPNYSKILLEQNSDKPYSDFLRNTIIFSDIFCTIKTDQIYYLKIRLFQSL